MPLSLPSPCDALAKLPRALSLAAAAVAAATTSLLLISVAINRSHHVASSSPPHPPSTSASTTAALPPSPGPAPVPDAEDHHPQPPPVPPCPPNATHLVPCHEPPSGERHCPRRPLPPPPHLQEDPPPHPPHPPPPPPHCRVPPPPGYHPPPPWPARRDRARYANVELPLLPNAKVAAGLGKWLVFPNGVGKYVEQLERVVPLRGGAVRTALDIGCGVASFGDYLLNYGVLTMSISPRNRHGAQVQLALERGLPAMLGALGAHRLPYPSRSFDMVHCADCLHPWTAHDGLYMLEIDRLLRPGGYWVYSRPPISWKSPYNVSNETDKDIQSKKLAMDDMAYKLHWTKLDERDTVAVWRKPSNHLHCDHEEKLYGMPPLCTGDPDSAWYTNTSMCITCLPRVELVNGCASGAVENWPTRLGAVPPRIASGEMKWLSIQAYKNDSVIWEKRVNFYITYLNNSSNGTYRNVMDMNAGFGGFAAAMSKYPVWVMNVVPANVTNNTLGIIYERGLVGTYMDWCEAFSTYPRTYDLIHADGIFSSYMHKIRFPDGSQVANMRNAKAVFGPFSFKHWLVEMDRILRPGGAVIVRDRADVVLKVKKDANRLRWRCQTVTENGHPEKLLIVDKSFPLPGS